MKTNRPTKTNPSMWRSICIKFCEATMPEFKTLPQFCKAINIDDRTVLGIFSVLGNVDDGTRPGAPW